jgi:hypothetical protein
MKPVLRYVAAIVCCCLLPAAGHGSAHKAAVELTLLDPHVPNFATFSSDVPHVAVNGHGIFVVYLFHEQSGALASNWGKVNSWMLRRSTDGGATFTTLFTAPPRYGKAPEIESDGDDNIYLFDGHFAPPAVDPHGFDLVMYKFTPADAYRKARTWTYANEAAGKFNALYDSARRQFYYVGFGHTPLLVIGTDGRIVRRLDLFRNGRIAGVQYPLLAMDGARLYVAWTTTPFGDCGGGPTHWHCALPVYYTIHFIYSDDGGASWRAPGGGALTTPIVSDIEGPAPSVVPKAYLGKQSAWLAGFTALHGVVHFMFQLQPSQNEIYEAFTVSPFARVHYSENVFGPPARPGGFGGGGYNAFGFDGFLTRDAAGDIYAVTQDASKQSGAPAHAMPLIVLTSRDNGATWADVAHRMSSFAGDAFFSGPRMVSPRYGIVGVFTGSAAGSWAPNAHEVFFFRVPADDLNR